MNKKIHLFCAFLLCMLFVSCNTSAFKFSEPEFADNTDLKAHIYHEVDKYNHDREVEKRLQNPFEAATYGQLYDWGYYDYSCELSTEERAAKVEMVDWDPSQNGGDSYNCYFIYYRVNCGSGVTLYALVELTEFDDGTAESNILGIESTLSGVKNLVI